MFFFKPSSNLRIVGLLLGLLSLATPGLAQREGVEPSPPPYYPCKVDVFFASEGQVLEVRWGAGADSPVMGQLLASEKSPLFLRITGSQGSWLHFSQAQRQGGKQAYRYQGWVYASLLSTRLQASGEQVPLYRQVDLVRQTRPWAWLKPGQVVRVLGCQQDWVEVQGETGRGWLAPENQCALPTGKCP